MRLLQLNFLARVRDAILWRAHHWLGDRVVYGVLLACATVVSSVPKGVPTGTVVCTWNS